MITAMICNIVIVQLLSRCLAVSPSACRFILYACSHHNLSWWWDFLRRYGEGAEEQAITLSSRGGPQVRHGSMGLLQYQLSLSPF